MFSTTFLKPSEIHFSQDSIKSTFQNGNSVNGSIRLIETGLLSPHDFPLIQVFTKPDGKQYTLDNRRLYVFRVCEFLGLLTKIEVMRTSRFDARKFTTVNEGVSVRVRGAVTQIHYKREWFHPTTHQSQRGFTSSSAIFGTSYPPRRDNYRNVYERAAATPAPQPAPAESGVTLRTGSTTSMRQLLQMLQQNRKISTAATSTTNGRVARTELAQDIAGTTQQNSYDQIPMVRTSTSRLSQRPTRTAKHTKVTDVLSELERALEYSRNLMRRKTPGLAINDVGDEYFYDEDMTHVSEDEGDHEYYSKRLDQKKMMYWRLKKFFESI